MERNTQASNVDIAGTCWEGGMTLGVCSDNHVDGQQNAPDQEICAAAVWGVRPEGEER